MATNVRLTLTTRDWLEVLTTINKYIPTSWLVTGLMVVYFSCGFYLLGRIIKWWPFFGADVILEMSRWFCFSPRRRSFAHLEPEIFRAGDGTQRVPEEVSFWISKVGWFNPTNDETLGVWSSILTHHWSSSKSQLHCRHLPVLLATGFRMVGEALQRFWLLMFSRSCQFVSRRCDLLNLLVGCSTPNISCGLLSLLMTQGHVHKSHWMSAIVSTSAHCCNTSQQLTTGFTLLENIVF